MSENAIPVPVQPESIGDTGVAESTVEQLILKILYFRGDLYGQDLSQAIGLKFSVIQDLVETLKLQHLLQVKRSLGMGSVGAVFALTDSGRARAREALEFNQYSGPAPVPLEQYAQQVRKQRPQQGWLTKEGLAKAFQSMVVTERILSQVGPAVSSANSMLLYGKPGDGKTFLIESLQNLDTAPIFVPYAVECQGNIVQVFDPIYHRRVQDQEQSLSAIAREAEFDGRWVRCQRPFIVSGGELSLDMLDLRYNLNSKVYEAPFQLKANNGIYLIDDFGRQRATPAEVLNRWIVPMERKVDYLSFLTGGKMTAPFETFLVFSTNLNPADLGDEAFLRRIQYKMLLRGPSEDEFIHIFERLFEKHGLAFDSGVISQFIQRHYRPSGKPFRRCHPRDLLSHALNLINFEGLPRQITNAILDRAFESCFLAEEEDAQVPVSPILKALPVRPFSEHLEERMARLTTAFGRLMWIASLRDREKNIYHLTEAGDYSQIEINQSLASTHVQIFQSWLGMNPEQKSWDLVRYLSSAEGRAAFLSFDRREFGTILSPASAAPHAVELFRNELNQVVQNISGAASRETPARMAEKTA